MKLSYLTMAIVFVSSSYASAIRPNIPFHNVPLSNEIVVGYHLDTTQPTLICTVNRVNSIVGGHYWKNDSMQMFSQFDENIPLRLTINPKDDLHLALSDGELQIKNLTRLDTALISCEYKTASFNQ